MLLAYAFSTILRDFTMCQGYITIYTQTYTYTCLYMKIKHLKKIDDGITNQIDNKKNIQL